MKTIVSSLEKQPLRASASTQIKFTIESDIVSTFKSRCASEGVSMTSAIRQYMQTSQPAKNIEMLARTRPMRRKAVMEIIRLLNGIMDNETEYRDNIPEAFEQRYEAADYACDRLADAIACLEEAF